MDSTQHPILRAAIAGIATLVVLTALAELYFLAATVAASTIAFDADEANHALDGWQVYHALSDLAPGALLRALTDQSHYPPVHSLFVTAGYLVGGPTLAASRLPTVFNLALTLAALAWLTYRLAARGSDLQSRTLWLPVAGSAFAVALAITSEVVVTNSILAMLEMTGALLGVLLLLAADKLNVTVRYPRRLTWLLTTGLLAALLMFTKYSFGLFFVPGLVRGTADSCTTMAYRPARLGRSIGRRGPGVRAVCVVVAGHRSHNPSAWLRRP